MEKEQLCRPCCKPLQYPIEDVSMTESVLLTLYFNTLYVHFHVDGLEGHQRHHWSWYLLVIITKEGWASSCPWITTLVPPNHTAASTDLFFILQRRRVAWGATRLLSLLVMCSHDKNQRKRKNPKIAAGSVQNGDFYCKKWSFALLLLTNPLSYTIRHNISMEVVAIGGLLSLPIGQQRVIIMVIVILMILLLVTSRTKITS